MTYQASKLSTSVFVFCALLGPAQVLAAGNTLIVPPEPSNQCQDFVDFSTQGKIDPQYIGADHAKLPPFHSDSVLVMKDGKVVYEWYDGKNATPDTSHILWSASKDITALLIARTIQEGYSYRGKKFTLQSKLQEFFPYEQVLKDHPNLVNGDTARTELLYKMITIDNLVQMAAGFDWKEYYDSDITQSSFMPMLYTIGHDNMSDFALQAPMSKEGPGNIWNYSGGNANILMAILQKIHGDRYFTMPWDLLFNPLGITGAKIERDASNKYIGSSYIYMTTRDMAKIGQLLVQGGRWNGRQLLPPTWTQEAQEVDEAVLSPATKLDVIKALGTEGKRIFWLNKNIYREDGTIIEKGTGRRILYPQEMPQAPSDMFFAAGHYGQLIIVIPSHNMVIIHTGANVKYWDHIQPFAVKALACVDHYQPNPVEDLTPPSAGPKKSFLATLFQDDIPAIPDIIKDVNYLKSSGVASAYFAKEMCSYLFTSNVAQTMSPKDWKSSFVDRLGFPSIMTDVISVDMEIKIDANSKSVQVSRYRYDQQNRDNDYDYGNRSMGPTYLNRFVSYLRDDPRDGCALVQVDVNQVNNPH